MSEPTLSKIVCVGRNYAEHARELNNTVPETPILFMKPPSALASTQTPIRWNTALGECHYETEVCVRMGAPLTRVSPKQAIQGIDRVTLGLDLTLRDVQNTLKANGYPWERAKAFDGSAVLGEWLPLDAVDDLSRLSFSLWVNGEPRQQGNTEDMVFDIASLLSEISHSFSLQAGDIIMTGTPAGVGPLRTNDQLEMRLDTRYGPLSWTAGVAGQ